MKVLLLDSCGNLQESLQQYLELLGHEVGVIDNTTSALSMCAVFDTDLLITEYISDDPDYIKLFKQIHTTHPLTKIVILSCNLLPIDKVVELTNAGVDCVYEKPINPDIIKNTIDIFEKKLSSSSKLIKQISPFNIFTNNHT